MFLNVSCITPFRKLMIALEVAKNGLLRIIGTVRYCTVFSFIVLLYCESYIYKSNM